MQNKDELRLSVSKTKCLEQCKKQFKFSYILKLPKKEHDYHIFGKFAHRVLEDFHGAYINGSVEPFNKIMTQSFKAAQEEYKEKMTPEMTRECFDIINKYLKIASNDRKNNLAAKVIAVEKNFALNIADNIVLNGMIDRIQLDDDGVVHVADYKTTKNKKYLKNDFFQLLTYAYVIMSEDPSIQKVRASYILLRHDFEHITTEFSVPQIMEIKDKYLKYAQMINDEKEFPASTSALCAYCDYLDLCTEGKAKVFGSSIISHGETKW